MHNLGLTKEDFVRILKEPKNALTRQDHALFESEDFKISFDDESIDELRRQRLTSIRK